MPSDDLFVWTVSMSSDQNTHALNYFVLSRYPFSAEEWGKDRQEMFSQTHDTAIMGGSWDSLSVRQIVSAIDEDAVAHQERHTVPSGHKGDAFLPEQRVIQALGPIKSTASFSHFKGGFKELADKYVFLAYVEIRLRNWPLEEAERAKDCAADIIEATAKVLSREIGELNGDHAIFQCLGHSDLIIIFCSNYIHQITRMFFKVRSLRIQEVWEAVEQLAPIKLDAKYGDRHIVENTHTSFGFFCESVDALLKMEALLNERQGKNSPDCSTLPTVLCALRPGHESTVEQVREDIMSPEDQKFAHIQVITGIYDLRLSYVPHPVANGISTPRHEKRTEAAIFGWLTRFYHALFLGNSRHIRNIHTSWGFDPVRAAESDEDPNSSINLHMRTEYRGEPLGTLANLRVRHLFDELKPRLSGAFGEHWRTLQDFIDRYDAAAQSPLLARYLADVHSFLLRFKDALDADSRNSQPGIHPHDVELLLRRMGFILVGRLSGGAQHGEPDMAFGAGMTRQKIALALNCVAEEVGSAILKDGGREIAIQVGFSIVGGARTTRWHWKPKPNLVLIELPVTDDIHSSLYSVIHEVANVVELRSLDVSLLRPLLLGRLASILAEELAEPSTLSEEAAGATPRTFDSLKQTLERAVESDAEGISDIHGAINRFATLEGLAALLSEAKILPQTIPISILAELSRIAARAKAEMGRFERLCARARADIVTAHICGWPEYLTFLTDCVNRMGDNHVDPSIVDTLSARVELLYHVGVRIGRMNWHHEIKQIHQDFSELLNFLVVFAGTTSTVLGNSAEVMTRTQNLCNELRTSGWTINPQVARRLLQLWVSGWRRPLERARNKKELRDATISGAA